MGFTDPTFATNNIQSLADQPIETSAVVKQTFDKSSSDIKDFLTSHIDELEAITDGASGMDKIGMTPIDGVMTTPQQSLEYLKGRADATQPTLNIISVLDYGAVGDGVTDDTMAIQTAFDNGGAIHFPSGLYFLDPTTMAALTYGALNIRKDTRITFDGGAKLTLETDGSYGTVVVCDTDAENVYVEGMVIEGDAFANAIAPTGLGGDYKRNIVFNNCHVKGVKSELIISAQATPSQNQGGVAFVCETEGEVKLNNCSAIDCQFGIRYAPSATAESNLVVTNFYAENLEAILNTNPSAYDNRNYRMNANYNEFGKGCGVIDGIVFKNCGKSSDERINASFIWVDAVDGNYHPHAGQRRGASGSTYDSGSWEIYPYDSGHVEYNSSTTYTSGDIVKVENNDKYSALFAFGRAGKVSISNVRGWNDHYSGAYPRIGAIARGIMRDVHISNVHVDIASDHLFLFGTSPSTSMYELQPFMSCQNVFAENIFNLGSTVDIVESDMPINGTWATSFGASYTVDYGLNVNGVRLKNISLRAVSSLVGTNLRSVAPAQTVSYDNRNSLEIINIATGNMSEDKFSTITV